MKKLYTKSLLALLIIFSFSCEDINEDINSNPNDILINNSKVCGILQELVLKNDFKFIIIGIGINLFKSPNIPDYKTSYLNNYSKKKISKSKIIKDLKKKFEKNIKKYT